jgi:hypothetical protein
MNSHLEEMTEPSTEQVTMGEELINASLIGLSQWDFISILS